MKPGYLLSPTSRTAEASLAKPTIPKLGATVARGATKLVPALELGSLFRITQIGFFADAALTAVDVWQHRDKFKASVAKNEAAQAREIEKILGSQTKIMPAKPSAVHEILDKRLLPPTPASPSSRTFAITNHGIGPRSILDAIHSGRLPLKAPAKVAPERFSLPEIRALNAKLKANVASQPAIAHTIHYSPIINIKINATGADQSTSIKAQVHEALRQSESEFKKMLERIANDKARRAY